MKGTLSWVRRTGKGVGSVIAVAGIANPAKIIDRHGEPFDLQGFDFVMNINVRGSIDLIRQVLPHLSKVKAAQPDGKRGVYSLGFQLRRVRWSTRAGCLFGIKGGNRFTDAALDTRPCEIWYQGSNLSPQLVRQRDDCGNVGQGQSELDKGHGVPTKARETRIVRKDGEGGAGEFDVEWGSD